MTENTPTPDHTKPPRWDLSDLFPAPQSAELKQTLADIKRDAQDFERRYKGRIARLNGDQLGDAIEYYEQIRQKIARVSCYTALVKATDINKSVWAQNMMGALQPASGGLLFFTLEINKLGDKDITRLSGATKFNRYAPWVHKIRTFRDYQLSDELEKYIHDKSQTGANAWVRLFDMTMADMRFTVRGQELTATQTLHAMNGADADLRRDAFDAFGRVLGENKKTLALVTNTLAAMKQVDDQWRGYKTPEQSRHLLNQIEPEVVDAMVSAVRESYPRLSHKYYAWKAKKFGVQKLHPADRNAPFPDDKRATITWDKARDIVLSAYHGFSKTFADIAKKFFDNNWIDAEPREGKRGGAFSMSTTPDVHPYIMMNWQGAPRDLKTLSHELGHGIHQTLAAEQGLLKSATPLTLAETASVFGEMLAFREMLNREPDLKIRRSMIASKVEDMMNTVVRQTSFFTFEQKIHTERREKGELTPERISDIWVEVQKESLGPAVDMETKGAENFWAYIPHFVRSPFYVYAYAFGDCLVNALYDTYSATPDKQTFANEYIKLLKAGGTKQHKEALAPFGLDASDPAFWKKGLSVIERYIDELIELDRKIENIQNSKQGFKDTAQDVTCVNDNKPASVQPKQDKPRQGKPSAPRKTGTDKKL